VGSGQGLLAGGVFGRGVGDQALVLVDFAPVRFNPILLIVTFWLVIITKPLNMRATVDRHDSSAVAYVGYVRVFSDDKHNYGTRTRPLHITGR